MIIEAVLDNKQGEKIIKLSVGDAGSLIINVYKDVGVSTYAIPRSAFPSIENMSSIVNSLMIFTDMCPYLIAGILKNMLIITGE